MNDPTPPPDAAAAETSALTAIALAAAVAAPVLLAGCGGAGGGDPGPAPDTSPTLSITSIEVRGTTATPSDPVTINTNAQPAVDGVVFTLNGSTTGTQMLADPGRSATSRSYDFAIRQSGSAGRNLTVIINPSPTMVIPAVGAPTSACSRSARSVCARRPWRVRKQRCAT